MEPERPGRRWLVAVASQVFGASSTATRRPAGACSTRRATNAPNAGGVAPRIAHRRAVPAPGNAKCARVSPLFLGGRSRSPVGANVGPRAAMSRRTAGSATEWRGLGSFGICETEDRSSPTSAQSVARVVSQACPLVAGALVGLVLEDEVLDSLGSHVQFLRPGLHLDEIGLVLPWGPR